MRVATLLTMALVISEPSVCFMFLWARQRKSPGGQGGGREGVEDEDEDRSEGRTEG